MLLTISTNMNNGLLAALSDEGGHDRCELDQPAGGYGGGAFIGGWSPMGSTFGGATLPSAPFSYAGFGGVG